MAFLAAATVRTPCCDTLQVGRQQGTAGSRSPVELSCWCSSHLAAPVHYAAHDRLHGGRLLHSSRLLCEDAPGPVTAAASFRRLISVSHSF